MVAKTKHPLPFNEPTLSTKDKERLDKLTEDIERKELLLELASYKQLTPLYEKRRAILKNIPKFWPAAIFRNHSLAMEMQNEEDQKALEYLEDVWVQRSTTEPRVYTLEFTFTKNPYFEDRVLKKEFVHKESPEFRQEKPDGDGFRPSMLKFDWDDDVEGKPFKITWKKGRDLSKKYPAEVDEDGEVTDLGSFFNWFQTKGDVFDLGPEFADELFPDAIAYFSGEIEDEENDSDGDEDEAEEDSDSD